MTNQISSPPFPVYFKGGTRSNNAHEVMEKALRQARSVPDSYRSSSQDEQQLEAAAKKLDPSNSTEEQALPFGLTWILPYSQKTTVSPAKAAEMRAVSEARRQGDVTEEEYDRHKNNYEASKTSVTLRPAPGALFEKQEFYPPEKATPLAEEFNSSYYVFLEKETLKSRVAYKNASQALRKCLIEAGFSANASHYGSTSDGKAVPFYRSRSSSPAGRNKTR